MLTKLWVIGATGFTQGWSEPTGLEEVWRDLRALSTSEVCVVTPLGWDADAAGFAQFIARNSAPGAEVVFYGHSYGVGVFFLALAEALQGLGITIVEAVFADGIRRFTAAKFLSLKVFRSLVTITVPWNVRRVRAFYQRNDALLQGHDVVAEDARLTSIEMIEQPDCTHITSDEDLAFFSAVIDAARTAIADLNLNELC